MRDKFKRKISISEAPHEQINLFSNNFAALSQQKTRSPRLSISAYLFSDIKIPSTHAMARGCAGWNAVNVY